ncbi:sine oculis-binding protein homolog B [Ctenopharyngodon idella]|uniref:sine oculis-binding protein homolog B n=1 Tax=Ctenopharyngodon idella TaxID=7959 RepID=UPI002230421F|nr:sine oculis-binding protein homolog B [Ctenopharyngodon idella]
MPEMETGRPPENKRSRKPAHPVKRDVNEEMKNFAESTMNELLGWYGYDKVDLQESDASDARNRVKRHHISVLKENSVPKPHATERKVPSSSSEPVRNGEKEPAAAPLSPSSSSYSSSASPRVKEQHSMNVIVPLIKPSAVEDVQNVQIVCVWCQKEGMKRYSLLMGSELKSFCSEKCFAACRRAYFKRNKARDEDRHGDQSPPPGQTLDTPTRLLLKMNNNTRVCDWCKHVRHTKEYLDFGSGEERLQFCSTKCLNQYKMDVFYREARAALTSSKDEENRPKPPENQKLLTPEAWDPPAKTLSPQTPTSSSSLRTPVSKIQTGASPSSPAGPSRVTLEQPRPPQVPLPFVRPPLHAQSPAPHPPRPVSPTHRAPFAPPPFLQPYASPYAPFHPPYPPQMPPPWPQPMMFLPYPVFVPIPVPIPIPIPVSPQTGHRGVIRSLQEQEKEETNENRVKIEQCASPLPSTSERQVIRCLRRNPVKEENHDAHILRKALYTSVVTATASASLDSRVVTPASLYSLARSTAIQAASLSLDSGSAQIPSPLSDCEDVKENSYLGGRDNGSANPWPAEQTDCQSDQSKESRGDEDAPQDAEHTYARSVPPKLREKNTHTAAQTHLHTQTHTWEKNTLAAAQGSEQSGPDDPEPPVKRRCLRIRDQNK